MVILVMDLQFNMGLATDYKSMSQKIRVASEDWVYEHCYCPYCGNDHLQHFPNNKPVADFYCDNCGSQYELKSKSGSLGRKIADGAYDTMIDRITGDKNPDLFVLNYDKEGYKVNNLLMIPKFFFVPHIIEQRKPLGPSARRAGWVGCNILFSEIPQQGIVNVIKEGCAVDKAKVIDRVQTIKTLKTGSLSRRGWLMDILSCVSKINKDVFTLQEVYAFADILKIKHPENNNIKPKIRQQLQFLRDKGIIEFMDRGVYRKIFK